MRGPRARNGPQCRSPASTRPSREDGRRNRPQRHALKTWCGLRRNARRAAHPGCNPPQSCSSNFKRGPHGRRPRCHSCALTRSAIMRHWRPAGRGRFALDPASRNGQAHTTPPRSSRGIVLVGGTAHRAQSIAATAPQIAGSGGHLRYVACEGGGPHLAPSRPASSGTKPQLQGPGGGGQGPAQLAPPFLRAMGVQRERGHRPRPSGPYATPALAAEGTGWQRGYGRGRQGGGLDAPPPPQLVTTARVGITLEPRVLLGEDVKKGARGRNCATVHDVLQKFVPPSEPSSFPLQEAGDAKGGFARGRWQLWV